MAPISLTPSLNPQALNLPVDLAPDLPSLQSVAPPSGTTGSFGSVFENMISGVEQGDAQASAVTRSVLLGDNPNIHQSVIAMQEASLNFSLMVQVRNKVVESYQELMRLPV